MRRGDVRTPPSRKGSHMPHAMPFGKHKGTPIAHLDLNYIEWCLDQDWIDGQLRNDLDRERKSRSGPQPVTIGAPPPPAALEQYLKAIILGGYKVCLDRAKDNPTARKNLQAAREKLEEFAGL